MDYFADYEPNNGGAGWDPMNPMNPMNAMNPMDPMAPLNDAGATGNPDEVEAPESEEKMSFEEAMARLERIVQRMESGNVSLDESLELFKEGSQLAAFCQKQLSDNENKIRQLLESEQGAREVDFRTESQDQ